MDLFSDEVCVVLIRTGATDNTALNTEIIFTYPVRR